MKAVVVLLALCFIAGALATENTLDANHWISNWLNGGEAMPLAESDQIAICAYGQFKCHGPILEALRAKLNKFVHVIKEIWGRLTQWMKRKPKGIEEGDDALPLGGRPKLVIKNTGALLLPVKGNIPNPYRVAPPTPAPPVNKKKAFLELLQVLKHGHSPSFAQIEAEVKENTPFQGWQNFARSDNMGLGRNGATWPTTQVDGRTVLRIPYCFKSDGNATDDAKLKAIVLPALGEFMSAMTDESGQPTVIFSDVGSCTVPGHKIWFRSWALGDALANSYVGLHLMKPSELADANNYGVEAWYLWNDPALAIPAGKYPILAGTAAATAAVPVTVQPVNVNVREEQCCQPVTIIHELFHSLGYWHTQQRADQASFVYIPTLASPSESFSTNCKAAVGVPVYPAKKYPYASIMHYGFG